MTTTDRTDSSQSETLAFEFDLPHPPTKVWRALTEPELLAEWLMPVVNHRLEEDAEFTITAPPQPGWDGIVNCRFLVIEPQKSLSWSWATGDLDTVVTFTLTPTETGTRLMLVQSGFKSDQKRNFGGARYGWNMMGGRLHDVLERLA